LLVNGNTNEDKNININLIGKNLNSSLRRYLYDPATITLSEDGSLITFDKVFYNVTNLISDTLPPKSVVVYTNIED